MIIRINENILSPEEPRIKENVMRQKINNHNGAVTVSDHVIVGITNGR